MKLREWMNPWTCFCMAITLTLLPCRAQEQQDPVPAEGRKLARAVNRALLAAETVPAATISVEANGDVVLLQGVSPTLLGRERAERIAEAVPGVFTVVNRIQVEPRQRRDLDIRTDIQDALLANRTTEGWEVDIEVENGAVLLTGTVDSWREAWAAADAAAAVPGVLTVVNRLIVEGGEPTDDGMIAEKIRHNLIHQAQLDTDRIGIDVDNGFVRLSGAVDTQQKKRLAIQSAWVAGVHQVNAAQLNILRPRQQPRKVTIVPPGKTDLEILRTIQQRLQADPELNATDIVVDVREGVATLSGQLPSEAQRRSALQEAANAEGVKQVIDNITVPQ